MKKIMGLGVLSVLISNFLLAADMEKPICVALSDEQKVLGLELVNAAKNGNEERVEALLKQDPTIVNVKNEYDLTALALATIMKQTIIVEKLLAAGAAVDIANKNGWTPLMWSAGHGHAAVVEKLLAAGAVIDRQENTGFTALIIAARKSDGAIVEKLLASHAMPDIQNDYGDTALISAACYADTDIVSKLIEYKADFSITNQSGKSALEVAQERGRAHVVDLLTLHASIVPEEEDTMVKPAVSA